MSVYRPKYRDQKTGKPVQSKIWWYEFSFADRRIRESAKTKLLTLAREAEANRRRELERAYAGMPSEQAVDRVQSVADLVKAYKSGYAVNHRAKSIVWVKDRTAHVVRLMGSLLLPDLTENRIRAYIEQRIQEGAGNRTVNMELLCLSRAIGRTWRELWPKVKRLEEPTGVGRALAPEEEIAILQAAAENRSPLVHPFVRVALLTAMRHDEIRLLRWSQIDFDSRIITVGTAKTRKGTGREIPMNQELHATLSIHVSWYANTFGRAQPEWYVFPRCNTVRPVDPTRPATAIKTAWESVRVRAGEILRGEAKREAGSKEKRRAPKPVACRFHDLRHTVLTKMAEAGVPESTMLALAGHMSRTMLERYSHIRMKAKRAAVDMILLAQPEQKPELLPKVSPKVEEKPDSPRLV
jgi:integrase